VGDFDLRFAIWGPARLGNRKSHVAPFIFDTTFTIIRRALNHENVLRSHQSHLYQRLVRRGVSHGSVSVMYTALAAVLATLGALLLRG
jgi:UDP-N-acetylmuramyl pentapeptide phosphotransferase/UDP-N-acetylglucosamine-1-phosphate transferase